jgi:hypothetical protein
MMLTFFAGFGIALELVLGSAGHDLTGTTITVAQHIWVSIMLVSIGPGCKTQVYFCLTSSCDCTPQSV